MSSIREEEDSKSFDSRRGSEQDSAKEHVGHALDAEALADGDSVSELPQGRHMGVISAAFLMVNRIVGTGVFATTSTLLSQSGSVGMSLLCVCKPSRMCQYADPPLPPRYWVIGAIVAGAGFAVYAEFATAMPRNGGELNYLQRAFQKPKHLVLFMYASQALLLGQAAGNAFTAGQYFIRAGGGEASQWGARGIGVAVLLSALVMHGAFLKWGILFQK